MFTEKVGATKRIISNLLLGYLGKIERPRLSHLVVDKLS